MLGPPAEGGTTAALAREAGRRNTLASLPSFLPDFHPGLPLAKLN